MSSAKTRGIPRHKFNFRFSDDLSFRALTLQNKEICPTFQSRQTIMSTLTIAHQDESSMEKGAILVPTEHLVDSIKGFVPLAGLHVVHLLLGLLVDRLKSGKPVVIEEMLAR